MFIHRVLTQAIWGDEDPSELASVVNFLVEMKTLVQKAMDVLKQAVGNGVSESLEWSNDLSEAGEAVYGTPGAFVESSFGGFGAMAPS